MCDHASRRSVKTFFNKRTDHAVLDGGEIAAFDLGVPAFAAKEGIDQREHELGIQNHQPRAAQRMEPDQVEARRQVQLAHVLAELEDFDRAHRNDGRLRSKLYKLVRNSRPKRSLIISSVGIRPRTMRTLLPRS